MTRHLSSQLTRFVSKGSATMAGMLLIALASLQTAHGDDLLWLGGTTGTNTDNDWTAAQAWAKNNPGAPRRDFVTGDNVTFDSSATIRAIDIIGTVKPGTLTIATGVSYSFTPLTGGSIQASGAITINGALTLNAAATNTASLPLLSSSSTLTVNNSGSLILAGPGNNLADTTSISLNGGQILISSGRSETLGALTFSSSTSAPSLDFSGTGSSLTFSSITGSTTLNVFNFDPTDHLYLTSALAPGVQIKFYSGSTATPGQEVSYSAEVVPEPSTIIAGIGLVGFLGWRERRRIGSLLKRDRDAGELATA